MNDSPRDDDDVSNALRRAGVPVDSVYDLVNTTAPYPSAIPVLLDYLPMVRDPATKEGIVRALGVVEARPLAAMPLIEEFRSLPPGEAVLLKWAIANSLCAVADDSAFEPIAELLLDPAHGKAREMLALCLSNMITRREEASSILTGLLQDEEVAGHAVVALGRLRAASATAEIEPFLRHPKAWIRSEARKALVRIRKVP